MTRLMSPLTVSIFCARLAVSSPMPPNETAPSAPTSENREQRAFDAHVKDQHSEAEQQCHLDQHEHQTAAAHGEKEIGAAHGRRNKSLQQFALAHLHYGEADAPHA